MLARGLEEPGLGLLELVHVVVVVRERGASRLHVAHARELQLEVDPVALSLSLELGDLAAQLLGRLCVLRRLGNLGLQGGDLFVALGDLPLVVGGVVYLRLVLLRFLLLLALLLRRVLRTLRGFLASIGLTVHVSACLSSRKAGRDEQCPHLYRYGIVLGCHKVTVLSAVRHINAFAKRGLARWCVLVGNPIEMLRFVWSQSNLKDYLCLSSMQSWTAPFNPGTLGARVCDLGRERKNDTCH